MKDLKYALLFLLAGCGQNPNTELDNQIQDFDVSPDGNNIIVSWYSNKSSSIYTTAVDGTKPKLLLTSKDHSLDGPRYSNDGKKVLFISGKLNELFNSLCIYI